MTLPGLLEQLGLTELDHGAWGGVESVAAPLLRLADEFGGGRILRSDVRLGGNAP